VSSILDSGQAVRRLIQADSETLIHSKVAAFWLGNLAITLFLSGDVKA